MAENKVWSWQVPPIEALPEVRAGWYNELVQSGDRFIQAQPGLQHLTEDISLLMGVDQDRDTESNLLQPDIRTFVETITDLRQIATMGCKAEQFKKTVALYNELFRYIFWDSNFVWNTRKALQYAMCGRGYLWQKFSRDKYGWGNAKITFDALGPREVLPEQLPSNNDVQGCYAVTIVRPMPVAEAHARFPQYQKWLSPFSRYDWKTYGTLGMSRRLDFYDRFRFMGNEAQGWEERYCELRYHFIRDLRINTTGQEIQMGIDGTTWGYKVPTIGQLIVSTNPFNGLPESRKATEEDCRMYPRLRLAITSPSCPVPLYDDTSFDMHGEIPVVQYDVNDWAWSAMGYSAIRNVAALEIARRDRISEINTIQSVRKNPPMGHDLHSGVSRTQLEKLDLLHSQGIRMGLNGKPGEAIKSILPPEMDIDAKDFQVVELLSSSVKAGLGLTDLASMRELKGNLSENSLDKMLENLGPMAKGIAVNMWMANSKHANMLKYNIAQYFTTDDLMNIMGPEGVGIETFDNDPTSLVPSHLPGELTEMPSRHDKLQRVKWFCDRLKVTSTPAQLLNVTHQQERMLYMMFLQKGLPIPMETIMEKLGIDGYAELFEKWKAEKLGEELWKLRSQKVVQMEMKKLGIEPPEPAPHQGQGGGRPHSGKQPPKAEMKGKHGGEVRVVNSTS